METLLKIKFKTHNNLLNSFNSKTNKQGDFRKRDKIFFLRIYLTKYKDYFRCKIIMSIDL